MSKAKARACEMLKVAAEYIRDTWPDGIAHYDGTDCDGYCVADDCESAAEILAEADLFPSGEGVKELVEAIRYLLTDVEYDLASAQIARAALAKLEGGK